MATETYPVRFDERLMAQAAKLAKQEQRTLASLIRIALVKYIEESKK